MNGRNRRWLVIACAVFLALDVFILTSFGMIIRNDRKAVIRHERDALARQMRLPSNVDDAALQTAQMAELGKMYRHVTLYSEAICTDGKLNIMLSNGEENQYAVRMELLLFETGELIGYTDLVDPGWRVEDMDVLLPLAPGNYQCLARLHFYTLDGTALLGTMGRHVQMKMQ